MAADHQKLHQNKVCCVPDSLPFILAIAEQLSQIKFISFEKSIKQSKRKSARINNCCQKI